MDDKFKEEIVSQDRIHDEKLLLRILKNSQKRNFDYLDSVYILKNKSFAIMQLVVIICVFSIASMTVVSLGYLAGYMLLLMSLLYCAILYKKLNDIELMVAKEREKLEIEKLKEKITKSSKNLYMIMEKNSIPEERIKYTKEKFNIKEKSAKSEEDFKRLLTEINDDIAKYKNFSGESKKTKKYVDNVDEEIIIAYTRLNLPINSSLEEVKKKYKELIKIYHPDANNGDTSKMIELNDAFNTLKAYLA